MGRGFRNDDNKDRATFFPGEGGEPGSIQMNPCIYCKKTHTMDVSELEFVVKMDNHKFTHACICENRHPPRHYVIYFKDEDSPVLATAEDPDDD